MSRLGIANSWLRALVKSSFASIAAGAFAILLLGAAHPLQAAPRLISYGYPNCVSCHVSVQGRGLLNSYGRGIDIAQSYSQYDLSGSLLGAVCGGEYGSGNWDGRIGNVLADFTVTGRINQDLDKGRTDPTLSALYRQIIFFDKAQHFRVNAEVGFRDTKLKNTRLSTNQTAVGGQTVFLKKFMVEVRLREDQDGSGSEIAVGRDYLPLGLQIDDYSTYLLHLNRNGIYDFPLQAKYFTWNAKSLTAIFAYGPSFNEAVASQEWGGGFMHERYLSPNLALGVQGLLGFARESDRGRVGVYTRWGISTKLALLAEVDYTRFWNGREDPADGNQLTAFLQLHYNHTEWLISSLTGNYAHSDLLTLGQNHFSGRYTLAARISRNLTIGVSYAVGDILRNLDAEQEGYVFASVKF